MFLRRGGATFAVVCLTMGCSGAPNMGTPVADGGSFVGDDASPSTSPSTESIDGFDLQVKEGSWWEFSYVEDMSWFGDTGNGSSHDTATFLLVLGAPITIAGDPAFAVDFVPIESSRPGNFTFSWRYLSFAGKRIRASNDGATYSVLFDANTAIWPATSRGLFDDFPSDKGVRQATSSRGSSGVTWGVAEANSSNGCETIPGYGTVCGNGGDVSNSANEVYSPGVGLTLSQYEGSSSSTSGSSSRTNKEELIDSSVTGDRPPPTPVIVDGGPGQADSGKPPSPAPDSGPGVPDSGPGVSDSGHSMSDSG
jgi:hypothetical protein